MENREHDNACLLRDEEDREWKTPEQHATDLTVDNLVVLGILVRLPHCVVELRHKPLPESLEL
ncbi:MAG TPA: hypothetical protein VLT32_11890 [Candidatus Sulfomarinibacteraceae bacterium]|nr:hypothetical protein [Candidatus Sulfomarinibacteraceae bacterium]